eukprot:2209962-Rhodomonas_salina.1
MTPRCCAGGGLHLTFCLLLLHLTHCELSPARFANGGVENAFRKTARGVQNPLRKSIDSEMAEPQCALVGLEEGEGAAKVVKGTRKSGKEKAESE